jgi:Tfp pilus assembly protein PilN
MYQQINLYQPIFRKQRQIFSALTMVQASGVVAAALLGIYFYGLWQVTALEREVAQLERREQAAIAQLGGIDPTLSTQQRNDVDHELRMLNQTLLGQRRLIDVLGQQPLGTTEGFSPYLAALGRQHGAELWLTEFAINGATSALELAGESVRADLVPEYLQRLGHEPALVGQRFDRLHIERNEDRAGVAFRVTSSAVAEGQWRESSARQAP